PSSSPLPYTTLFRSDGDTSRLDPAVAEEFRATGMTHLLAVSGANVAIVLSAVLLLARWCRAGPTLAAVLCTVALVGFVILVRPSDRKSTRLNSSHQI